MCSRTLTVVERLAIEPVGGMCREVDGEAWRHAAADVAQHLQVPIASYVIGSPGLTDHTGTFFTRYETGYAHAVLVRPDGYVAWRSTAGPTDAAPLSRAIEQILSRDE
jgi:putative polyketide hydroxylase